MAMRAQTAINEAGPFDRIYYWSNNATRLRFHRQRCRIIAKGSSMRSALIEFEDGERIVTSIRAVRKA